ncbi:hypothetical protein ELI_3164 [Eubacterium callanderi]|uniref:Uncharacterized protein n=1 Tax=Eubacterium callanderi TaxID=53442 RepID=E3GEL7_9FIRM|nr:hypothetical protein ELI_3164 [Eubacterium callanderi]
MKYNSFCLKSQVFPIILSENLSFSGKSIFCKYLKYFYFFV